MKTIACLVIAAGALASPVVCLAQTPEPLTRAEVRADLVRVEQAGYNPSIGDNVDYPADIQAAEAKIAAQDDRQLTVNATGGTTMEGTSAAGGRPRLPRPTPASCVGPASFCNLYFGN
jgi:hypothetical protein